MIINIISIYLFVAVILTSFLAAFGLYGKDNGYTKTFSVLSFCISIYLFGYLMEINSTTLEQMMFWNHIEYVSIPFFPAIWLMITIFYTKDEVTVIRKRTWIIIFIIPVITFILMHSNSIHYLFYESVSINQTSILMTQYLEKGLWYFVQCVYILLALLISSCMLYRKLNHSAHSDRQQFKILFIASIIPLVGVMLILIDYKQLGIDYVALLLPFTLCLLLYAVLKYNFLEIGNLARENIFENSSDVMLLINMEYLILDYNRMARDFFYRLNINLNHLYLTEISDTSDDIKQLLITDTAESIEFKFEKDNKIYEIFTDAVRDSKGKQIGMMKIIRDITEERNIQATLKKLATIDELSGLNNRRHFLQLAGEEFDSAYSGAKGFSIIMIDIDDFKIINDTLGHAAGDVAIVEFGKLMKKFFRNEDICGRLGGEEFSVLLSNIETDDARKIANEFRKAVAELSIPFGSNCICLTVSIGVSMFCKDTQNIDELIMQADNAMYESKANGRNKVTTFDCL